MNDERTTAYLLNELSEREAEEFEEQCFAQPQWPEVELESAEEDLIQAYLREELSPERHQRFEQYYLTTPAREDRLLIARSFLRVACSGAPQPQPLSWKQRIANFFNPAISPWAMPRFAGVLLAIGLLVILALYIPRMRSPRTFADLTLVIAADTRGASGKTPKVRLPIAEDALRISLTLPESAPAGTTYEVQWEDVKGPIEELKIDKQDANSLTVIIPADKLKPGQQTLKLYRTDPGGTKQRVPGSYLFDVE